MDLFPGRSYWTSIHYATDFGVVGDGVTDNALTLQAAVNSFPNNKGRLILPAGTICTSAQIELPATAFDSAVLVQGAGKSATSVKAIAGSWSGKGVFYRSADAVVLGGGLKDLTVDAAGIADYAIYFRAGKQTIMESVNGQSAVVTEGLFGDAATPRFYETKFIDCAFYTGSSVAAADRPNYNLRLIGYATDNEIISAHCANAKLANMRIEPGGNTAIGCHVYGSPGTLEADYCYDMSGGSSSLVDCYADGFTVAGVHLSGNDSAVIGCRFSWPATVTGDAVLVAASRTGIVISNNSYYSKPSNKAEVAYAGTLPSSSYIQPGLIYTDGTRQFLGYTTSLSTLDNARLQIAGTDFNSSGYGQGRWSADTAGPFLQLFKSRGATIGTLGLVSASDQLGAVEFQGDDGVQQRAAVRLLAQADGTPSAGVMPGRLNLQTATVGTATITTRMFIDSRANVVTAIAPTATNAQDGYLYVPTCAGTPTGTPRTMTGAAAIIVDTTNNKLYFYSGGAWRDAGP